MNPKDALEAAAIICGSQKELADRIGVAPQTVSYWMRKRVPKKYVRQLVEICDHQVTYADFRPDVNWEFLMREAVNE